MMRLLLMAAWPALLFWTSAALAQSSPDASVAMASLTSLPNVMLHYAPNGNFNEKNEFTPGRVGFNVADIADPVRMRRLGSNIRVLVWVGQCDGVSAKFLDTVRPFLRDPRVFGFYLMDDPDPRPRDGLPPPCPPENLKAESDWLHKHVPGTKTVVVLMNLSDAKTPTYMNSYTSENSHVDLFGLCAYPCRTAFNGCDFDTIDRHVAASDKAGIPRSQLIPIYQAFGGGLWRDDWGGSYIMPSPADEVEIIRRWRALVPSPVLDMAYSWGTQREDTSLHDDPKVMEVFSVYNQRWAH